MSSSATRYTLVIRALGLAGRSVEITTVANEWLNEMLRDWALDFRFPSLRKIGTPVTLPQGSTTAPLPSDFGAGMEKQGLLFGVENIPLNEKSMQEFIQLKGFPQSGQSQGRPNFYMIDRNAGKFVFNSYADQSYPFTPVYYSVPADMDTGPAGDQLHPWPDNDRLVTEGLVERIMGFTEDARHPQQYDMVYHDQRGLFTKWKRQVATMGGTNRVLPSAERFKTVRF